MANAPREDSNDVSIERSAVVRLNSALGTRSKMEEQPSITKSRMSRNNKMRSSSSLSVRNK